MRDEGVGAVWGEGKIIVVSFPFPLHAMFSAQSLLNVSDPPLQQTGAHTTAVASNVWLHAE